jgi:hypothetical protein
MELVAVHLHYDALLRPDQIDFATGDPHIGERWGEASPVAHPERQFLGPGTEVERWPAGSVQQAQQLAQQSAAGMARPAVQQHEDLCATTGIAPFRRRQHLLHLPRGSDAGDVQHGPGRRRNRNAVHRGHFVVAESGHAVHTGAGGAPQHGA